MEAAMWDPGQYQRFAGERGRPFFDLLTRVKASDPGYVVDLGCSPGNLTAALAERWPGADVVGLDNSPEMIGAAQAEAGPRLRFALGDLREWRPARPVDVLVSNAVLQWVPGPLTLCGRGRAWWRRAGCPPSKRPANTASPATRSLLTWSGR